MQPIQRIKVSENNRYLVHEDETPFFWLGDTTWDLFHSLKREEVDFYLAKRAKQKFNVIQAVALAERDGLTTDNAYGRKPLKLNSQGHYDPAQPDTDGDYHYWAHVDYIVEKAASLGLFIAFLPTWADKYNKMWGKGPVVFNEANALLYGRWLGNRYKDYSNIIWVLGGDRPLLTPFHFAVNRSLAQGLREGDIGQHLITFHPSGGVSSSLNVHDEVWLDFNMIQSGHNSGVRTNYRIVNEDYLKEPIKPTLDGEPCYEDHPIDFKPVNGYFDQADVRVAAYYAVFSGALGHTYGHHSIWSMTTEPTDYFIMDWKTAIQRPGAEQMQYLRSLIEQRSYLDRVPDQSLISDNYLGANYMVATRGIDYALIYSPNGVRFRIVMGKLAGEQITMSWYDPRTGSYTEAIQIPNLGEAEFLPPTSGRGCDWVLVLERERNL